MQAQLSPQLREGLRLWIPSAERWAPWVCPGVGSAPVGREGMKVLLVEARPEGFPETEPVPSSLPGGAVEMERAGDLTSALKRLSKGGIDLVLLDLSLPDSQGIVTFERTHAFEPDVPIVVLTEVDDEEVGLNTVRGGAQDYLIKGKVGPELLQRSIRYAVERHRLTSALRSLSLIDDLTGLYNDRGFDNLGNHHLRLANRTGGVPRIGSRRWPDAAPAPGSAWPGR